jgi:type II secretory pathway pseudopilin PulG
VELMAVVTITGILATIGIVLTRNHLNAAKTHEALAGVQAIRAAQEATKAQYGVYLSCSDAIDPNYYPTNTFGNTVYHWRQDTHPDFACWRNLGVTRTAPTRFGYAVTAGAAGAAFPVGMEAAPAFVLETSPDPWYLIQVKGDRDGDGNYTLGMATSLNNEVFFAKED